MQCNLSVHSLTQLRLPSCPALLLRLLFHGLCADEAAIPHCLKKQRAVNYWGLFVFIFFIAAFGFYIWARATHTLGLGPMLW